MSTPTEIATQAQRWRRRFYLMLVVLAVLVVGAVGWFMGAANAPDEASPQPAPAEPSSTPAEGVFVPVPGASTEGDHPVNFPRTTEGATSAALAYLQAISTNDTQAWAQGESVYGGREVTQDRIEEIEVPSRAYYINDYAPEGSTMDPEQFPLPGSYFYINPVAVHFEELDQERVQVLILVQEEISDGAGLVFTQRQIRGAQMVWNPDLRGGDWMRVGSYAEEREWTNFSEEDLDADNGHWTPIQGTTE